MKVLWFINTPSRAALKVGSKKIGGSWIESLEIEVSKIQDIQLGVVFKWDVSENSNFYIDKTKYYIVRNSGPRNMFCRFIKRWRHTIDSENNMQYYLSIIQDFKPDVIHIFGTESDFGLITQKTTIPCIIHIQGNLTLCDHKWFSGISFLEVLKYSKKRMLMKGHGLFHDYFVNKKEAEREKRIFKSCQYFMGRTDWDKRITQCFSKGAKYFHCDEIMRNEFYLQKWEKKNATNYKIISVFRNNIYKGLETILKCQMILRNSVSGININWKIAGLEVSDEIVYLTEKSVKCSFHNNGIILLGKLGSEKLVKEMQDADLFVHSSHIDNSPNSVCEAMLLGMPIIATYAGGIPSLIEDKKEGILVQDGDPYALAGAIIEIIKNKDYASGLGMNSRIRALQRHNKDKIVNDLLRIYEILQQEKE